MTESLLRRARPRIAVAPLQRRDFNEARVLCARNPEASVMPAMHLESASVLGRMRHGQLWAVHDRSNGGRELAGLVWNGANLIPVIPDPNDDLVAVVAEACVRKLARPGAVVGVAPRVMDLWGRVVSGWGPVRELWVEQLLMLMSGARRRTRPVLPTVAEQFLLEPL